MIWIIYGLYTYYLWNVFLLNSLQIQYRYGTASSMEYGAKTKGYTIESNLLLRKNDRK
jgi:hypothetical protein